MAIVQKTQDEKDRVNIIHRYKHRIKIVKQAKEALANNSFQSAVGYYQTYLKVLADFFNTTPEKLHPDMFDKKQGLAELLIISQVYWDLCKIYDRAPQLRKEFEKSISKFILFTAGHKFQVLNAQMLRKYIKNNKVFNKDLFEHANKQIYINSKKCYIATHCFGESDPITIELRNFRNLISNYKTGRFLIDYYYFISPKLIEFSQHNKITNKVLLIIFKPLLSTFVKALKHLPL